MNPTPDPLCAALNAVVTKTTWRPDNTVLIHDGTAWNTLVGRIVMATMTPTPDPLREALEWVADLVDSAPHNIPKGWVHLSPVEVSRLNAYLLVLAPRYPHPTKPPK